MHVNLQSVLEGYLCHWCLMDKCEDARILKCTFLKEVEHGFIQLMLFGALWKLLKLVYFPRFYLSSWLMQPRSKSQLEERENEERTQMQVDVRISATEQASLRSNTFTLQSSDILNCSQGLLLSVQTFRPHFQLVLACDLDTLPGFAHYMNQCPCYFNYTALEGQT